MDTTDNRDDKQKVKELADKILEAVNSTEHIRNEISNIIAGYIKIRDDYEKTK